MQLLVLQILTMRKLFQLYDLVSHKFTYITCKFCAQTISDALNTEINWYYFCSKADRAKAIKTKAIVNESPTDKLIRELREENQRLLDQLKQGGVVVVQGEAPQPGGPSEEG